MKNRTKKILCALLAACLMLVLPVTASAAALGDVNADGFVHADDARLALRAAVKLEPIAEGTPAFTAADVTADGKITSEDARLILRASVGLETLGGKSEYDILRSGKFYMTGSMVVEGTASSMIMAIGDDVVYMATAMDDMEMGYLVKGNDIFLVNEKGKNYWKPNAVEKAMLIGFGLPDAKEIKNSVEGFGFSSLQPLSTADSVAEGTIDGISCTVYIFNLAEGTTYRVYMNGNKLIALETLTAKGAQDTYMRISTITATIPQLPPADYKKVNMTGFMSELM